MEAWQPGSLAAWRSGIQRYMNTIRYQYIQVPPSTGTYPTVLNVN